MTGRCTETTHVVKQGHAYCDCKAVYLAKHSVGQDTAVTIVDPVQHDALKRMGEAA